MNVLINFHEIHMGICRNDGHISGHAKPSLILLESSFAASRLERDL